MAPSPTTSPSWSTTPTRASGRSCAAPTSRRRPRASSGWPARSASTPPSSPTSRSCSGPTASGWPSGTGPSPWPSSPSHRPASAACWRPRSACRGASRRWTSCWPLSNRRPSRPTPGSMSTSRVDAHMSVVEELAERARETGRLGIDTEFMGEGRYRSLLCLVQVAVDGEHAGDDARVEVLDPLDDALEPGPLAEVLADPAVEVIMHAGRQDVALLRRVWKTEVTNVFDTQIAAGFAGLRAQLGYEPLVSEMLKERVRKSASFTHWDARPLSDEQLEYAREDVLHILALASALQDRLDEF